ncbi:hypothetical protein ACFW04_014048 [Cataglyphis niger]
MKEVPEIFSHCRILARNPDSNLQAIRFSDGDVVSGERYLLHLLETNFPDFRRRPDRVKWAVKIFKSFKSAGPDRIFPALLQEEFVQISGPLMQILRACWREWYSYPKSVNTCCTSVKDFKPISLTSFLLKTLEKLIEIYLRNIVLGQRPLHGNQHAYKMDFFTETALHSLVSQIERDHMEGGYAVGTFLDIKDAFNNIFHEMVCKEATFQTG